MIKDFTLGNNLKKIIGKFIRFSFRFSMVILSLEIPLTIFLLFKKKIYLTNNAISSIIIISCLPILLFTTSFLIYENLYPAKKTKTELIIKVILWISYLFIPSLILLYRFSDIVNAFTYIGILITLFSFFGISDKWAVITKIFHIFNDVKYIMFDFWKKRDKNKEIEHFESNLILERQSSYIDKKGLNTFQNTISCPMIDVKTILENKYLEKLNGKITVLDIGGAEGKFTSNLLKEYISTQKGNSVSKIQLIDPIDLKGEYTENLKYILNDNSILNSITSFEDWKQKSYETYDLVIASHSLYASIDNKKINYNDLINKLKKFVSSEGVLLIILGSREGRAYSFKKKALEFIFGEEQSDAESNSFIDALTAKDIKFQSIQTDNYIDLTILIKKYEDDNSTDLIDWLSYFLRVDKKNLTQYTLTQIVELLMYYTQPLYELSNFEIENFSKLNYPNTLDKNNSLLLLHKTDIIII